MRWLAAAGIAAALASCRGDTPGWEGETASVDAIVVARERINVARGPVGAGRWKGEGSYALVPATNTSDRDLMVTLRGAVATDDGPIALRPESIRLPHGGGERTFALVAERPLPDGAIPTVEVTGASAVDYAPPVTVKDGAIHHDQGRAVVAGMVKNTGRSEVKATIAAAFYDAAGRPMKRPFTVAVLTGGGERPIQIVGPPGSKSAQLYVVEVQY